MAPSPRRSRPDIGVAISCAKGRWNFLLAHRLKVPALLRKTLYSTNPIESIFSRVRDCEKNVKRARSSQMRQRWLAAVLIHCEKSFRKVKDYLDINEVINSIEQEFLEEEKDLLKAA
ncbi:MAG: hypothetical protein KJ970_09310 [Candidatus Eisenbacteria bacterium]|uniref:Transposase n=1 Tax=Eiseniibacteriota bacterium TaxID=2212470 RepID=A0A948RV61_UNCEI|nr:hypothetical protein [Candidatus Eisenbacteria bacterium]